MTTGRINQVSRADVQTWSRPGLSSADIPS